MWFSQSSTPQSVSGDDLQKTCTNESWPPRFQTYEKFKEELDIAISECPGFGEWLLLYRNINHIHKSDPPVRYDPSIHKSRWPQHQEEAIWCLTVTELKKRSRYPCRIDVIVDGSWEFWELGVVKCSWSGAGSWELGVGN